jgi:hypothetical protein
VNWVEMQCADGDSDKTHVFQTMKDLTTLLRTATFKGKTLIAHYSQGFGFHLLYKDAPIMKGNKIMKV